jgi:uncharacterized protein (TIGR02453 family)
MPRTTGHFAPELFRFLNQLERNNRREWFEKNKPRYLEHVRDPMLRFIADFGPKLRRVSSHFVADPSPVGGSMFRIHRDVRFAKDKRPYKTAATARFPHERGKDVHTPGWYLHLAPDAVRVGSGIWRPDSPTLHRIRAAIVAEPAAWKKVKTSRTLRGAHAFSGDSLKRPPRGFDPEHPFVEDLMRTDIVTFAELDERAACAPDFLGQVADLCRTSAPLVRFLCGALDLAY